MDFSTFVKLLYPYCSAGEKEAEFIVTVTNNIMEESDNCDNPLTDSTLETRKRIFNGKRPISKQNATFILSKLDKSHFIEYIDSLSTDTLEKILNSLNKLGFDTNIKNVATLCADLLTDILDSIASGKFKPEINKADSSKDILIDEANQRMNRIETRNLINEIEKSHLNIEVIDGGEL